MMHHISRYQIGAKRQVVLIVMMMPNINARLGGNGESYHTYTIYSRNEEELQNY